MGAQWKEREGGGEGEGEETFPAPKEDRVAHCITSIA